MRWILQHEHVVKDELEAFKIIEQLFQSDQYRHSAATKLSLKVLFYEVRWAAAESVADFRKTLYPTVTDIQGRFPGGSYGTRDIVFFEALRNDSEGFLNGRLALRIQSCFCQACCSLVSPCRQCCESFH